MDYDLKKITESLCYTPGTSTILSSTIIKKKKKRFARKQARNFLWKIHKITGILSRWGAHWKLLQEREIPPKNRPWEQPLPTVPNQGETSGPHQQPTAAPESYWGNSASEASDGNPHWDGQIGYLLSETCFRVFFPILAQSTLDIFVEHNMGFQHTHYWKGKPGPHQPTLPGIGLETLG